MSVKHDVKHPQDQDPDPEYVRNLSEYVYRSRLSLKQLSTILHKDGGRERLRRNAAAFDSMTRTYLEALKVVKQ